MSYDNSKMDEFYARAASSDSDASIGTSCYGGSGSSQFSVDSMESCDSLLSTSTTYGSYYQSWSGKDTCGYEADLESNASSTK